MQDTLLSEDLLISIRFLIMSAALSLLVVYLINFYKKGWNKAPMLKKWFYIFLPVSAVVIILKALVRLVNIQ